MNSFEFELFYCSFKNILVRFCLKNSTKKEVMNKFFVSIIVISPLILCVLAMPNQASWVIYKFFKNRNGWELLKQGSTYYGKWVQKIIRSKFYFFSLYTSPSLDFKTNWHTQWKNVMELLWFCWVMSYPYTVRNSKQIYHNKFHDVLQLKPILCEKNFKQKPTLWKKLAVTGCHIW